MEWSAIHYINDGPTRLTTLPTDHRQFVNVWWPGQSILSLAELLELHGELALADLVLGEHLEVAGEAEFGAHPDEPLRRVVLIPPDGVAVVHWELVVEIVVALADGDQRGDEMVARGVFVVEWGFTEPMG